MKYFLAAFLFSVLCPAQVVPGAVGFGSGWTFPSTYEVYVVTNLNNSGAGSLREAVTSTITANGRIVVFNGLSGTITLSTPINFPGTKPIYIAGQTSQNGILIKGDTTKEIALFAGTFNNVIIRSMVLAVGAGQITNETVPHSGAGNPGSGDGSGNVNGDNITVNGGSNAIFDHLTLLWSTDESFNAWGNASNITLQNSIIGWSLEYATHAYATDSSSGAYFGVHSMGALTGGETAPNIADRFTFYNVVFAHTGQRNPQIKSKANGEFELVNIMKYNIRHSGSIFTNDNGANTKVNIINMYDIAGTNTSTTRYSITIGSNNSLYIRNAITWKRPSPSDPEWNAVGQHTSVACYLCDPANSDWRSMTAHNFPLKDTPTKLHSTLEDDLLEIVGTIQRTSIENTLLGTIENRTGSIIDWPSQVGGYPTISAGTIITDSDNDGIPNSEEATWGNDTFGYVNSLMGDGSPSPPTCSDGIQNGDETGVDCGGSCPPCEEIPPSTPAKKTQDATLILN